MLGKMVVVVHAHAADPKAIKALDEEVTALAPGLEPSHVTGKKAPDALPLAMGPRADVLHDHVDGVDVGREVHERSDGEGVERTEEKSGAPPGGNRNLQPICGLFVVATGIPGARGDVPTRTEQEREERALNRSLMPTRRPFVRGRTLWLVALGA